MEARDTRPDARPLALWAQLIRLGPRGGRPLQVQIRQAIVSAISEGRLSIGVRLPSSRDLAAALGVARNTVVLAYQHLVDEGHLLATERSGHYVAERSRRPDPSGIRPDLNPGRPPDWQARLLRSPSLDRNIVKPSDWQRLPYPFVYGQSDLALFPVNDWRECVRSALGAIEIRDWSRDLVDGDDAMLVDEIRKRVLPLRGVFAAEDEVMVTMGAQQALFLLAALLMGPGHTVGIEEPGYPDARNIVASRDAAIRLLPLDEGGLLVDRRIEGCDYLYVTPSHQCPTTATLALDRREALIAAADRHDIVIIEDDYEIEVADHREPLPALKSLDRSGRVLYVGSLSKTLAPGLRLGYLVAPAPLIRELRALRRMMLRHPPANNQRAAALFIALGHYEAHLRRFSRVMGERALLLEAAMERHLAAMRWRRDPGATSLWVEAPHHDTAALARAALAQGVVIEPGGVFFGRPAAPCRHFRLGFSAIPAARIDNGVAALAHAAEASAQGPLRRQWQAG
jgi:GntR family transcriptional regulator / MocR family aminotransferase